MNIIAMVNHAVEVERAKVRCALSMINSLVHVCLSLICLYFWPIYLCATYTSSGCYLSGHESFLEALHANQDHLDVSGNPNRLYLQLPCCLADMSYIRTSGIMSN